MFKIKAGIVLPLPIAPDGYRDLPTAYLSFAYFLL